MKGATEMVNEEAEKKPDSTVQNDHEAETQKLPWKDVYQLELDQARRFGGFNSK